MEWSLQLQLLWQPRLCYAPEASRQPWQRLQSQRPVFVATSAMKLPNWVLVQYPSAWVNWQQRKGNKLIDANNVNIAALDKQWPNSDKRISCLCNWEKCLCISSSVAASEWTKTEVFTNESWNCWSGDISSKWWSLSWRTESVSHSRQIRSFESCVQLINLFIHSFECKYNV